MFTTADKTEKETYIRRLVAQCSLSLIHSNSSKPYLEYREAENIFCECFHADNKSRSDVAVDGVLGNLGIGVKTFVEGTPYQKIAEFDKKMDFTKIFDDMEIVKKISKERNYRIDKAMKKFSLNDCIYHYIVRYDGLIKIFECPMYRIDIDGIKFVTRVNNVIEFTDGIKKYKFYLSKSTLLMEFDLSDPLIEVPVKIINDPAKSIVELYENNFGVLKIEDYDYSEDETVFSEVLPDNPYLADSVILPLFSTKRKGWEKVRYVPEKSGLNQWNAAGRVRDPREVYIPVPRYVHNNHPGFFPPRTESFSLELPGGKIISAKLCQSGDKGLMSNPNKELGRWLLDSIFEQPVGKVLTYDKMELIKVNGVRVSKLKNGHYYMNFIYIPEDYELGKMVQVSSSR